MKLSGKTALVTGGGGGIGAAIAKRLDQGGAHVIVADLDLVAASSVASHLRQASAVQLDIGDLESIQRVTAASVREQGPIHLLVNSAGTFGMQSLLDVTPSNYDRFFDVNTRGTFFMLQHVARSMVEHQVTGSIINIASQAGRRGEAASSIYAATKAAVISLTQSAALALIGRGIRVNAVAPGVVDTPMWTTVDRLYADQYGGRPGDHTVAVTATIPPGGWPYPPTSPTQLPS